MSELTVLKHRSRKSLKTEDRILNRDTLKCPDCKEVLHFEAFQMMRIIRDGLYSSFCPICKTYNKVKAPKENT